MKPEITPARSSERPPQEQESVQSLYERYLRLQAQVKQLHHEQDRTMGRNQAVNSRVAAAEKERSDLWDTVKGLSGADRDKFQELLYPTPKPVSELTHLGGEDGFGHEEEGF